jgi:hypothetical protein
MWVVAVEKEIGQERLAAGLGVEAFEDLVDQALIADESVHAAFAGEERQHRKPVGERDGHLLHAGLRLGLVRRQHPCGVGGLLHRALRDAADREMRAPGHAARRPHSEALVPAPHQVGHVQRRREAVLEPREVRVLRRADDSPTAVRCDRDPDGRRGHVRRGHPRRAEVPAAVRGQHEIALPDVLDRLRRPVRHRDRRSGDETLVVVPDNRQVPVL